jgi:hypothetical protein
VRRLFAVLRVAAVHRFGQRPGAGRDIRVLASRRERLDDDDRTRAAQHQGELVEELREAARRVRLEDDDGVLESAETNRDLCRHVRVVVDHLDARCATERFEPALHASEL